MLIGAVHQRPSATGAILGSLSGRVGDVLLVSHIDKRRRLVLLFDAADSACLPSPAHKGAHRGTQSGDGDFYGSANWDWWRHVARCACQPNADGVEAEFMLLLR